MDKYQEFLESKRVLAQTSGFSINPTEIHPILFDFQRAIVQWACRKGRCAVFADTGLGKTFIQVEWARLVSEQTQRPVLIVAPLSVARQTVRDAKNKLELDINYTRSANSIAPGINITNYEMLEHFDASVFGGVALDESSILKSFDGATRRKLIEMFASTLYRSCYTATPAPNDYTELGNHSEFLGVCKMMDMLAMFFVHANKQDEVIRMGRMVRKKQSNDKGQEWRLKNHARENFYRWLASWAMSVRTPSDLGFSDEGYILPPLTIQPHFVDVDYTPDDQLFFTGLHGIADRSRVRHITLEERVKVTSRLVNSSPDQFIIWCGLNDEANAIHKAILNSVNVQGSDNPETKANAFEQFQDSQFRVLITKPKIGGFGMNFQNAHNMVFLGLNDSWEWYYQCIRRQYRFGQKNPVNVYIVLAEVEREIYDNVMNKERQARAMGAELIKHVRLYEQEELNMIRPVSPNFVYKEETITGANFTVMLGDSAQRLKELTANSIDLSVYSPPFADLYTYSASEHDLGNSRTWDEFFSHYQFIIREVLRVTKPGRLTCVHTSDIPAMQMKDGYIGMKDFPGAVIRAYESEGWIFVGRAIVGKNPQAQAIRTKAKALLFVQLRKDSSDSRPAILDQVLLFKKPGENQTPVLPVENGEIDNETWIDWAGGIWTGIQESDTLQYTTARENDDEKHIAPLQLGTIERCVKLYSNRGETVLTPFLGIGSEAYVALKFGRRAVGIELKESYFRTAVKNLKAVEVASQRPTLFDGVKWEDKVKA